MAKRHTTYVVLTGGRTRLRLNPGTAAALTDNDVAVTPASEAKAGPNGISLR